MQDEIDALLRAGDDYKKELNRISQNIRDAEAALIKSCPPKVTSDVPINGHQGGMVWCPIEKRLMYCCKELNLNKPLIECKIHIRSECNRYLREILDRARRAIFERTQKEIEGEEVQDEE
jgi:hypothetical protein